MSNKRVIFAGLLFSLIFFTGADSALAQRSQNRVKDATWQISVDASQRGNVVLGIRDKWGTLGRFNGLFVITGPRKQKIQGRKSTTGDDWAYINFPDDFEGKPITAGNYTVVFYVNGVVVGRDKFRYRP